MRISESPLTDRSASEPPEIQLDLEKEYAIEQLSLLPTPPPRSRSIAPSGFQEVVAEEPELPKPRFQDCAYYKLPPEIRRLILRLSFGGRRLHIDFVYNHPDMSSELITSLTENHCGIANADFEDGRSRVIDDNKPRSWHWWGSVCHRLPPNLETGQTGPMTHGGPDGPWADTCRIGEAKHCQSWPGSMPYKCHIGVMGWLLSCRQNYAEAIDVLYSTNTIIMASEVMIMYLSKLLLAQRLLTITSLEISSILKIQLVGETRDAVDSPSLAAMLETISTNFPQLRRFYLSLEEPKQWCHWMPRICVTICPLPDSFAQRMQSLKEHAVALPNRPFDDLFRMVGGSKICCAWRRNVIKSYYQIWRPLSGDMEIIRLPYVDSYPDSPYHIASDSSGPPGYWILNGTNGWKEKIVYVRPVAPPVMDNSTSLSLEGWDKDEIATLFSWPDPCDDQYFNANLF